MKAKNLLNTISAGVIMIVAFLITITVKAQITQVENLFGKYALSVDGCENNNGPGQSGSCPITINKPTGATLFKAYLVASQLPIDMGPFALTTPLRINNTNVYAGSIGPTLSTFASSGLTSNLKTRYANVTTDLTPLLNSLPAGAATLYLMPDNTQDNDNISGLEGRTLLVIWNDPNGSDKVISIALGSTTSLPATTFTVNTPPLNITAISSTAIAGLGINFSVGADDQINNVAVNSNVITTLAGGLDDGDAVNGIENGNLFTIGDDADALSTITEKYNIKTALVNASTSYTVTFQNVSGHAEDYLSVYYSVVSDAFQTGTVTGTLYDDANTNFIFDVGEAVLPANITVNLYRDIDGTPGLNELTDQLVATTVTNASGQYTVTGVTVGTNYIVHVNLTDPDIPSSLIIETTNPVLNVTSSNGVTSTVNFGFIDNVMPVTLTHFAARKAGSTALLSWHTSSEQNSDYFAVERSKDGIEFIFLGKVDAAGNSTTSKSYSFTDANPLRNSNYYRLKMVDNDGSFKYSETRMLKFDLSNNLLLQPNPARNTTQLSGIASGWRIKVLDSRGRKIQEEQTTGTVHTLFTASLPVGIYIVQVLNEDGVIMGNQKLVKE